MNHRIIVTALAVFAAVAAIAGNITIRVDNSPASGVFAEVAQQSGKNFIYTPDLLKGMDVSLNIADATLDEALEAMFGATEIGWRVNGNNITLFHRRVRQRRFTVSGFVRERGSGEALAGVVLKASPPGAVTTTNAMGFYSLSLPEGDMRL